jgi:uncharacterized UBP type Zn finger protein
LPIVIDNQPNNCFFVSVIEFISNLNLEKQLLDFFKKLKKEELKDGKKFLELKIIFFLYNILIQIKILEFNFIQNNENIKILRKLIFEFNNDFTIGAQHDAREVLSTFIKIFENNKLINVFISPKTKIFEEILKSDIKANIGKNSITEIIKNEQPFIDLNIDDNSTNIQMLINNFLSQENIEDLTVENDNFKYKGNGIKKILFVEKKTKPNYIILNVKRYKQKITENETINTKITNTIESNLNINIPYTNSVNINFKTNFNYKLKSIISHEGESINNGHYSFFRREENEKWYEYDSLNTTEKQIDFEKMDKKCSIGGIIYLYELEVEKNN